MRCWQKQSIGIWFATTLEILSAGGAYKLLQGYGRVSIVDFPLAESESVKSCGGAGEKILAAEDNLLLTGFVNRCVERMQAYNRPDAWPVEEVYQVYNARMFGCELK